MMAGTPSVHLSVCVVSLSGDYVPFAKTYARDACDHSDHSVCQERGSVLAKERVEKSNHIPQSFCVGAPSKLKGLNHVGGRSKDGARIREGRARSPHTTTGGEMKAAARVLF